MRGLKYDFYVNLQIKNYRFIVFLLTFHED